MRTHKRKVHFANEAMYFQSDPIEMNVILKNVGKILTAKVQKKREQIKKSFLLPFN